MRGANWTRILLLNLYFLVKTSSYIKKTWKRGKREKKKIWRQYMRKRKEEFYNNFNDFDIFVQIL